MAQEGTTLQLPVRSAGEPSAEMLTPCNNRKACSLNWDRERRESPDEDREKVDSGEWVELQELKDEMNAGCEKCTIIYNGIQKYRQEFEGRGTGGATIYKTAAGISCHIRRTLRKGERTGTVTPLSLLFFVGKDNCCPWLPLQTFPKLASSTDSSETSSRLRRWIDTCEADHESCSEHSKATLPTRVLDLGVAADENGDLQLCEGRNDIAPYATLSHCWGSHQPLRTTKATLDLRLQKIRFLDLAKTFQDAAVTCRRLGIRYLWIDSLCIVQDDEEDWQLQSAQMASIYEGSTLTIAASSARDGTEGCFLSVPDQHRVRTLVWPGTAEGGPYFVHVRRKYPHAFFWDRYKTQREETQRGVPLFGRGWFYQERYLSRRVVHFTKSELWWECQTVSTCECEDSGPKMTLPPLEYVSTEVCNRNQLRMGRKKFNIESKDGDPDSDDPWHLCVKAYLLLSLTFEKDVFPALSGLAGKVQQHYKPEVSYYAGMWLNPQRNDLNDLLWINDRYPKSRVGRWRAPTWSWASVSEIRPEWLKLDPQHIYAELLDAKVKPYGVDRQGELRDAYIRLLGPLITGFIQKPSARVADRKGVLHPREAQVYIRDASNPRSLCPVVRLDVNPELCKPAIVPGNQVHCLCLGRNALEAGDPYYQDVSICLRVIDSDDGEPVFERIGIATHDNVLGPIVTPQLHSVKIV